jgi:glycogen phosphorylase
VAVESAGAEGLGFDPLQVGAEVSVKATVRLGELQPKDVLVEMYIGRLDEFRRVRDGLAVAMTAERDLGGGLHEFRGVYTCTAAGNRGLGIRVIPFHPDLATKYEMGRIVWA